MNTWPIFLRLQTDLAYGEGDGAPGPNAATEHAIMRDYIARIQDVRPIAPALVIGPGGPQEMIALRDALSKYPQPVHALTAHMPEYRSLLADCPWIMPQQGDIHYMPYGSGTFQFLHASNVLEHSLAPYVALIECRRVLIPGGVASFVLPSFEGREGGKGPFHLHCLTKDVWLELLRKTGFTVSDTHVQPGGDDPDAHYVHYRCVATEPPHPHGIILNEIIVYRATNA